MVISERLRCIFVHVQKTGGSSIETALRQHDSGIPEKPHNARRHLGARDIRPLLAPEAWDAHFKFAFVRNPWDRLVSWYFMCVQAPTPNAFGRYVKEHTKSFDDFVARPLGMMERTIVPQMDYIADADGRVLVDFVGRYETLHADFAEVGRRLGIGGGLPHANRSAHRPYQQYYGEVTRALVAERFARDIEAFGYTF
jgi:chondroitin 4-sulfotransferase 11